MTLKLGAMQPYFFPYLGYFDLINRTDRWVVFDVVEYHAKSWMNRNRILHPKDGWQYITVPVDKHTQGNAIKDVVVIDKDAARTRILGQITHYRQSRAPHYTPVRDLIDRAFAQTETNLLVDLNVQTLAVCCAYLGMRFDPIVLSRSDLVLPPVHHAGGWALELSTAVGATEYINPPAGREIFLEEEFAERGITLTFTDLIDYRYSTGSYPFVERLSIIDVLMWNDPLAVKAFLDERLQQTASLDERATV